MFAIDGEKILLFGPFNRSMAHNKMEVSARWSLSIRMIGGRLGEGNPSQGAQIVVRDRALGRPVGTPLTTKI